MPGGHPPNRRRRVKREDGTVVLRPKRKPGPKAKPGPEKGAGGPTTEEGKAVALANLAPPRVAAVKHGGYSMLKCGIAPPCNRCLARDRCEEFAEGETCAVAARRLESVVAQVMDLPHIQPIDATLAREFGQAAVTCEILDFYLSEVGPWLPGAESGYIEAQPVLKDLRWRVSAHMVRLADALGLTPSARVRLAAQAGPSAAERLAALFAEVDTIDAEGDDVDGDDDDAGDVVDADDVVDAGDDEAEGTDGPGNV